VGELLEGGTADTERVIVRGSAREDFGGAPPKVKKLFQKDHPGPPVDVFFDLEKGSGVADLLRPRFNNDLEPFVGDMIGVFGAEGVVLAERPGVRAGVGGDTRVGVMELSCC
jgi:hypothetical protein